MSVKIHVNTVFIHSVMDLGAMLYIMSVSMVNSTLYIQYDFIVQLLGVPLIMHGAVAMATAEETLHAWHCKDSAC